MKKFALSLLLLAALHSQYANAQRDVDEELLDAGAVDSSYTVIDENIYRAYMQYLNADLQEFLHRKGKPAPDPYTEMSLDENRLLLKVKIKEIKSAKLNPADTALIRKQFDSDLCTSFLAGSQVLRKRNWGLRGEVYNVRNQQVFSINKKMQDCPQVNK